MLTDLEAQQIMQKYGLLWLPHYHDDISKLTEDDMIELFGTSIQMLCPPPSLDVVPEDLERKFYRRRRRLGHIKPHRRASPRLLLLSLKKKLLS
jgi:hypothetical protein